jgi:hypothetical protein
MRGKSNKSSGQQRGKSNGRGSNLTQEDRERGGRN